MRRLFLVLASLVSCATAHAQDSGCAGQPSGLQAFAEEQLDVSSTAVPLTATKYAPAGESPAIRATGITQTDAVRIGLIGVAPTSTVGLPISAGQSFTICGQLDIQRFRAIRVTGDLKINLVYFR